MGNENKERKNHTIYQFATQLILNNKYTMEDFRIDKTINSFDSIKRAKSTRGWRESKSKKTENKNQDSLDHTKIDQRFTKYSKFFDALMECKRLKISGFPFHF